MQETQETPHLVERLSGLIENVLDSWQKGVEVFLFLDFLRWIIIFCREGEVIQFAEQEGVAGSHVVETLCYFAFSRYLHCYQVDGRGLHAEFNTERHLDFASSLPFKSMKYEIGTQVLVTKALKTVGLSLHGIRELALVRMYLLTYWATSG